MFRIESLILYLCHRCAVENIMLYWSSLHPKFIFIFYTTGLEIWSSHKVRLCYWQNPSYFCVLSMFRGIRYGGFTYLHIYRHRYLRLGMYRKISNIRCSKSQNLNASRLVLQLLLRSILKPGCLVENEDIVGADRCCSNYIWMVNNYIASRVCLISEIWR